MRGKSAFLLAVWFTTLPQAGTVSGIARKELASNEAMTASVKKSIAVSGRGSVVRQGLRKEMPKADEDVGGSVMKNAFAGESEFLRDASEISDRAEQADVLASLKEPSSIASSPIEFFNADASVTKADGTSSRNAFAGEEAFLNSVRSDQPHEIKWAGTGHDNQCVCGTHTGESLSIANCDSNDNKCQFVLPSGDVEQAYGQIKWAHDNNKCLSVHKGWTGNGNPIQLAECVDAFQPMNFTIFTPSTGYVAISWAKQPWMYPSHCLDVDTHYSDHLQGHQVVLWDCYAGAMWQFVSAQ